MNLDYPILKDINKDIQAMYKIYNLPATFLIDPNGKVTLVEEGRLSEAKIRGMMESIKP